MSSELQNVSDIDVYLLRNLSIISNKRENKNETLSSLSRKMTRSPDVVLF